MRGVVFYMRAPLCALVVRAIERRNGMFSSGRDAAAETPWWRRLHLVLELL